MVDELKRTEPWAKFALEQARIILAHLERGDMDEDFLRPHVLALLQAVGLPDEGFARNEFFDSTKNSGREEKSDGY